jgi:isoleucyl-tRNA synthetase
MIALEKVRDDALIAEGLLRDIARRLQALRKARGYSPTAILEKAMVAGLDDEMTALLTPLAGELSFLVRVRGVRILAERSEEGEWEEDELDGRPIYIDVS